MRSVFTSEMRYYRLPNPSTNKSAPKKLGGNGGSNGRIGETAPAGRPMPGKNGGGRPMPGKIGGGRPTPGRNGGGRPKPGKSGGGRIGGLKNIITVSFNNVCKSRLSLTFSIRLRKLLFILTYGIGPIGGGKNGGRNGGIMGGLKNSHFVIENKTVKLLTRMADRADLGNRLDPVNLAMEQYQASLDLQIKTSNVL